MSGVVGRGHYPPCRLVQWHTESLAEGVDCFVDYVGEVVGFFALAGLRSAVSPRAWSVREGSEGPKFQTRQCLFRSGGVFLRTEHLNTGNCRAKGDIEEEATDDGDARESGKRRRGLERSSHQHFV